MDSPKFALLYALALFGMSAGQMANAAETVPAAIPVVPAKSGSIEVARSGADVLVSWTMPEGEFRQLEIFRNTNSQTAGRGRVATVHDVPPFYMDQAPDLTVTYWYWLKLTRPDGTTLNLGPAATPPATVWQP
jgi:hypothetical protein